MKIKKRCLSSFVVRENANGSNSLLRHVLQSAAESGQCQVLVGRWRARGCSCHMTPGLWEGKLSKAFLLRCPFLTLHWSCKPGHPGRQGHWQQAGLSQANWADGMLVNCMCQLAEGIPFSSMACSLHAHSGWGDPHPHRGGPSA